MNHHLNTFRNLKILILGFAKSGYSISKFLLDKGAHIVIHTKENSAEALKVEELQQLGALFHFEPAIMDFTNEKFDYVIKSPGIPYSHPLLSSAMKSNIPIYTDIEVLQPYLPRTIGITGSNGKTTTTTLIELLLKTTFPHTFACGNIGVPVADILTNEPIASNLVMELSSFQLEGTLTFRPSISVLLNITPAHIDFHENFEHYVQAKTKITKNQKETDYVVYNIENTYTKKIAESSNATCIPFSVNSYHQKGACVKDGWIHYEGSKFLSVSELALPGKHNLENILASIIVSKLSGVPNEKIINILKTFTGVKHRLQYVGEFNERKYYNDSKATNSLAVKNAVSSFDKKPILIAGGLDRGNSYDDLVDVFKQCKYVLLIGESANRMYKIAQKYHLTNVFVAYDLPRAVTQSKSISSIDDVILLSPACASWDQYTSFEVRGDHFIELIYKGN